MATMPFAASMETVLLTHSPRPGSTALSTTSVLPTTRAVCAPGSTATGGGQFQSLCGLVQKVEPQLLSSPLLGAVRMFLPAREKDTIRPALAASTTNCVSPKVKV